ncbi:MAG: OmpA family protein [Hyphomicrobiales bacterium]|nr:OmpA family protein [Hyphomicrobiales bacterium]
MLIPLWLLANLITDPSVESDLQARAAASLPEGAFEHQTVSVAGRDVSLTGTPFEKGAGDRAATAIAGLYGVRLVNSMVTALPVARPYQFEATLQEGAVRLTGTVPAPAARAAIIAATGKANPDRKIIDAMTYASGAPAGFVAMAGAAAGGLADLSTGSVTLTDDSYAIKGVAATVPSYQHALAATQHLAAPMQPGAVAVQPPPVKDFSFAADKSAGGLTLSGNVPGAAERAAVLKVAQASDPGATITDHLVPASGLPPKMDFALASTFALDELAYLSRGHAAISAAGIDISGDAATTANAIKVKAALGAALPGGLVASTVSVRDFQAMTEAEKAAAAKAAAEKAVADKAAAEAAAQAAAVKKAAVDKAATDKAAATTATSDCQSEFVAALASEKVHFAVARADILPASKPLLDKLAAIARKCAASHIAINGYTDSDGNAARNQILSQKRAQAVLDYLTKAGVDASHLSAQGFGDADAVAPNDNSADKARNRRIEFKVTQ